MVVNRVASVKLKRVTLARRIQGYERRYEMPSSQMRQQLASGHARETAEVLKWMQAYRVHQFLTEKTHTTGTRGITTRPSTKRE